MDIENEALVLDLLEWLDLEPRTYAATIDVWRTSCPRLSIWEDTLNLGLATFEQGGMNVKLTPMGRGFLDAQRPGRNGAGRDLR